MGKPLIQGVKKKKQKKDSPCFSVTLLPRHLWEERRRMDLVDAMAKLVYNYARIPNELICELEELNEKLRSEKSIQADCEWN